MEESIKGKILQLFSFQSKLAQFLFCSVLILLYFQIHTGLFILNPFCFSWLIDNDELAVLFFGWDFYHSEPWSFPIGQINNYFYPISTNIYMTDIPLIALPLKVFSPILPEHFQFVGIWLLLCLLLQARFAILLCERLGIQGFRRILASLFITFCPVYLIRFQHATLFAHWMILACFLVYFMDPKSTSLKKLILYQLVLVVLSALLMLYLWLIIFGFSVALFLRLWLTDKKLKFNQTFLLIAGEVLLVLVIWVVVGLISPGSLPNYQSNGWGEFSMNLNSLFNPMGTSSFMPTLPYLQLQQLEGYAYLGAGILLLIIFSVGLMLFRSIPSTKVTLRYPLSSSPLSGINLTPLTLLVGASFIYSLSCNISFNQHILLHYELKGFLLKMANSFRASGRLSWILYYSLLLLLFHYINRLQFSRILINAALTLCLALQVYDLKSFFSPTTAICKEYNSPINPVWEKLIQSFDKVIFYPGFARSYLAYDDYRYFSYYAGKYHKKINIGYVARFDLAKSITYAADLNNELFEKGLDEQTLYVTLPPYINRLLLPMANQNAYTLNIDGYIAVFKKTTNNEKLFAETANKIGDKVHNKISWQPRLLNIDELKESKQIKFGLYEKDETNDHFFIKGWVFSEGSTDNPHDSVSVILARRDNKYWLIPAYRFGTDDVAGYFKNTQLHNSGFGVSFLKRTLGDGSYRVGLSLTNRMTGYNAFQWTDTEFTVLRENGITEISELPTRTEKLSLSIELKQINENEFHIAGWVFPKEGICKNCANYLVLSSSEKNYRVEFLTRPRPDVVTYMNDTSLLYSGVDFKLKKSEILQGTYYLGILMRDTITGKEYYSLSSSVLRAGKGISNFPRKFTEMPAGKDNVRAYIDKIEDNGQAIEISGWAFIDSISTDMSSCSIVFKSDNGNYEVSIDPTLRTDLNNYFKLSYSVDLAGISLKIDKNELPQGRYQICVMMLNKTNSQKTIFCLENSIEIP